MLRPLLVVALLCVTVLEPTMSLRLKKNSDAKPKKDEPWDMEELRLGSSADYQEALGRQELPLPGKTCRQKLKNLDGGLIYIAEVKIGGFTQRAVLDTGSFDTVVESVDCLTCKGGNYNSKKSKTFVAIMKDGGGNQQQHEMGDKLSDTHTGFGIFDSLANAAGSVLKQVSRMDDPSLEVQSYGSGSILAMPALDTVEIEGCEGLKATRHPMKEVIQHEIPVLMLTDTLTAIVGIGPGVNPDLHTRLHHRLGVERFSFCFPTNQTEDGLVIWNDNSPLEQKSAFTEIEVIGRLHWGVKIEKVHLTHPLGLYNPVVGCDPSCGSILDTGTSLMMFDKKTVTMLAEKWENMGHCEDWATALPSLTFTMGGKEHTLPPETFFAITIEETEPGAIERLERGEMPEETKPPEQPKIRLFSRKSFRTPHGHRMAFRQMSRSSQDAVIDATMKGLKVHCELLIGPEPTPIPDSDVGPVIIMGMPFFRYYYTTFDVSGESKEARQLALGKTDKEVWPDGWEKAPIVRKIYTAPANDCKEQRIDPYEHGDPMERTRELVQLQVVVNMNQVLQNHAERTDKIFASIKAHGF